MLNDFLFFYFEMRVFIFFLYVMFVCFFNFFGVELDFVVYSVNVFVISLFDFFFLMC